MHMMNMMALKVPHGRGSYGVIPGQGDPHVLAIPDGDADVNPCHSFLAIKNVGLYSQGSTSIRKVTSIKLTIFTKQI